MIHNRSKGMYGLGLVVAYVLFFLAVAGLQEKQIQRKLEPSILRFHVLAESDGERDQELKLMVRDAVLFEVSPMLADARNKEDAKQMLMDNQDLLGDTAEQVLKENGCELPVRVELAKDWFPVKRYGNLVLPEGEYEALRIEIGKAEGRNWWCMLFPTLCFVDESYDMSKETADEWQELLDEDEFQAVWQDKESKVEVRFWLWEKLQHFLSGNNTNG